MQKNDELILKIEDMGVDGAGIGKSDGMTFFVKDAVIGDVVRAKIIKLKKTYGYARLMELLEASADRVEPIVRITDSVAGVRFRHCLTKNS